MSQTALSAKMCGGCLCLLMHILLFLLALTKDSAGAQDIKSPALDFSRHRVVTPLLHHGRTKRAILSTRDDSGAHHSQVQLTVPVDGEQFHLDLALNEDLVTGGHTLQYQRGGETVKVTPSKEDLDLCHYSGSIRGRPDSWAAVSTCRGVRGVIFDGEKMRYIEPAQGPEIQSAHYLYDHNDLNTEYKCGYEGGVTNNTAYDPLLLQAHTAQEEIRRSRASRYKRDTDSNQVRGPFNANKQSRFVELVLVADHREFQANGDSIQTVHSQLIQVANIINSVYTPLNIYIALVGVVVWNERDEIRLDENGDTTLTNFLNYRERKLVVDIPNDNAHLLTRQKFKEGVVGKALKGPMCTFKFSGGVATNHSEVIGLVATTIAHEMGHNFGMEHDTDEACQCPDEKCIMSPSSTSVIPVHWSSCSLKSLALSFERGMDYCLRNKPKRLFDSPTCGNGFIEPGEQCDCGTSPGGGSNPCHACCHPRTCMLRGNATCSTGACCDLQKCRPKSAGVECRGAARECDLPEYCTGHSEYCPADAHRMDSTPCGSGDNQAYCVRGACRSQTDQCRLLWGSTGLSSDLKCYTTSNIKGTKNGNCGYDPISQVYKACSGEDALCGLLQCRHLNERLEFGMESVSYLSAIFINNNGTIIPCRTAIIDLGISDVDPGLVPDGASCGHEKMCLKQRCVPVSAVREQIAERESSVCPSNCSGHGVCNSEGHCHCEVGFAPPLCAAPGPGGSVDSGPASDPSVQKNFMIAMYVIFLGIIPSIIIILLLLYYSRHNVLLWWKRPRKSYVHLLCCANSDSKLTNNITKFQCTTASLRQLVNFNKSTDFGKSNDGFNKSNDGFNKSNIGFNKGDAKGSIDIKSIDKDKPIYANSFQIGIKTIELNKPVYNGSQNGIKNVETNKPININTNKSKDNKVAVHRNVNIEPKMLTKPNKKISKEDIQITTLAVNKPKLAEKPIIKTKPSPKLENSVKPNVSPKPDRFIVKPAVSPKPQRSKSPVVIVKQGLASTTNEMLSKGRLYNVGAGYVNL